MGVFTDSQLDDISSIVTSYNIPTFVLNKLVNNNLEASSIYYTAPSLEIDLRNFNGLLKFYEWDQVNQIFHGISVIFTVLYCSCGP